MLRLNIGDIVANGLAGDLTQQKYPKNHNRNTDVEMDLVGRQNAIHVVQLTQCIVHVFENKIDAIIRFDKGMNIRLCGRLKIERKGLFCSKNIALHTFSRAVSSFSNCASI